MQIWESRRWRRRLVLGTIAAVLVPVGYLAVHNSDPGDPGDAKGPEVPDYVQPKNSPFTASEKQAVSRSLKEFISSAVARENPSRAWDVSAPSMKQGVSREKWNKGDLPVVPYPAAKRGLGTWSFVQYSYTDSVMLEVFVFPKPGSGWSAMTADVELLKQPDGRWLVDYWMPKRFHGPPALAASQLKKAQKETRVRSKSSRRRAAVEEEPYRPPQASHWWLALPIAILSLIVIVPLTLGLVYWYRNRKATRAYLDSARGRT
jgi:hypothetical protein